VGDSPKEYLRRRRLTIAADRLLKEPVGILELALEYQFQSQEAFTRAFKQMFNMTPGQFRKHKDPFRLLYKDQFSLHMLNHIQNSLATEPKVIERPAIKLVGIASQYDENNLDQKILWSAIKPQMHLITNRADTTAVGIYEEYHDTQTGMGFTYVCAIPVTDFDHVPEGMETRELAAQKYIQFDHQGPLNRLPDTLKYIWGSWLPKSGFETIDKSDFELFMEGFNDADPDNILQVFIPIK
jgi:AraC family transcriptional regulator